MERKEKGRHSSLFVTTASDHKSASLEQDERPILRCVGHRSVLITGTGVYTKFFVQILVSLQIAFLISWLHSL